MANWGELHKQIDVSGIHPQVAKFATKYLKHGMRILDHGCGKGRHAIYLAEKGFEVHAVDREDSALDVLKERIEKDQLFELVKVTKADIRELPFPDGYFDAILSINVTNHGYRKDTAEYFKEAIRVLKKGGMMLMLGAPIEFLDDVGGPNVKEVEKGVYLGLGVPDHDVPHHLFTSGELRGFVGDCEIVRLDNIREWSEWTKKDVAHFVLIVRKK